MNKVVLQLWEESERGWGVRPDGCSIHLNESSRSNYIESIYSSRGDVVPHEYERHCGDPIDAYVDDDIFKIVSDSGLVRLGEVELNNLIKMQEVVIKH